MKRITCYNKKIKFTYVKITLFILFCCTFFMKGWISFQKTGDNLFHIMVNGTEVGVMEDITEAEELLRQARLNIVSQSEELSFMNVDFSYLGEEVLWGKTDKNSEILAHMEEVLGASVKKTMHPSYTVKVNEYMVNLSSMEEVESLLQAAINKYDKEGKFGVELVPNKNREIHVLTAKIIDKQEKIQEESEQEAVAVFAQAGIQERFSQMPVITESEEEKKLEDYKLGLLSMNFAEEVEIVEAYLPESQLTSLEDAIEEVTKEQELKSVYEVVSGDTLSEISIKVNIPMEKIIAMNDSLEDEDTIIRVGQELIITVPEPELSVEWQEETYKEENYNAEVEYIDVEDWYTNQTEVVQQPSAGFRKIIAKSTYLNDKEVNREIIKEEVVMEAVAKIVKRGTKIPPSYIKPISGGRQTSGFGRRSRPTKGASTYHKGVDWAVPTGTAVCASCGGTVEKAGWGSGYGYVVYINHEDGRQTRYGHLSKVLVKAGQTVKQGEKIALSGSTGVSTGPHLHFEILINGTQVNPLEYLP